MFWPGEALVSEVGELKVLEGPFPGVFGSFLKDVAFAKTLAYIS
jgi:hypothetical protein